MISSIGRSPIAIRWPMTVSNGIPGNAVRAKLALTIARAGARACSRASKFLPARSGMFRAWKKSPLTVRCWMLNPSRVATDDPARGPLIIRVVHP
jgi:hypothetical protein